MASPEPKSPVVEEKLSRLSRPQTMEERGIVSASPPPVGTNTMQQPLLDIKPWTLSAADEISKAGSLAVVSRAQSMASVRIGSLPPTGNLHAIEIVQDSADHSIHVEQKEILLGDVQPWFDKAPHIEEGRSISASLKLFLCFEAKKPPRGSQPNREADDVEDVFVFSQKFLDGCGLAIPTPELPGIEEDLKPYRAPIYHNGFAVDATTCSKLCVYNEDAWLVTTHDFDSATTRALYYHTEDSLSSTRKERTMENLKHSRQYLHHPLGLHVMMNQVGFWPARNIAADIAEDISDIIEETSMGAYRTPLRNASMDVEWLSRYSEIAEDLRALTQKAMAQNNLLLALKKFTDQLIAYNKRYASIVAERSSQGKPKEVATRHIAELSYSLEHMQSELQERLTQNDYAREDANLILIMMNRMATTRDAQVSIQIARDGKTLAVESKRDSTSMKTLAAVTMVFLPGTFVSSMFAMPLFQWTIPRGRVVSPSFWIYWAVTVPLTVFAVVGWIVWYRFKRQRENYEDKEAQKDFLKRGPSSGSTTSFSDSEDRLSEDERKAPLGSRVLWKVKESKRKMKGKVDRLRYPRKVGGRREKRSSRCRSRSRSRDQGATYV